MIPTDLLARLDTSLLYPPFLAQLTGLLQNALNDGIEFWGTMGFRSYAQQMQLWCQGRTLPGLIVTHAKAGESAHNFGLAVDLTRNASPGSGKLAPDWNYSDYSCLGNYANAVGLIWGGSWDHPDRPHIQWPGYVTAEDLEPLRDIFNNTQQLSSVWTSIGAQNDP